MDLFLDLELRFLDLELLFLDLLELLFLELLDLPVPLAVSSVPFSAAIPYLSKHDAVSNRRCDTASTSGVA